MDIVAGIAAVLAEAGAKIVRVNVILRVLIESRDFGRTPEIRAQRASLYPLGLGTPRDVGEAVLFLVSPAARWVSGTSLHITGGTQRGFSTHRGRKER